MYKKNVAFKECRVFRSSRKEMDESNKAVKLQIMGHLFPKQKTNSTKTTRLMQKKLVSKIVQYKEKLTDFEVQNLNSKMFLNNTVTN